MAFINEKIKNEKDIKLYNSFNLKNPIIKEILRHESYSRWTVDREREIYFMHNGGGNSREFPGLLALVIKNQKILLEVIAEGNGDYLVGIEAKWQILRMFIPNKLDLSKEIIMEYLKEAIETYEKGPWNDGIVKKVEIELLREPTYVDGEVYEW